jgi:hypothetical protein
MRHNGRVTLVAASALVVIASGAGIATAAFGSDQSETSITPSELGAGSQIDYCPTREELNDYWNTYGREQKPTVACEYDEPTPDPSHTREPEPFGQPAPEITTLAEAEKQCDPNNEDPWTLIVDDQKDGGYGCLMGAGFGEPPPSWVVTTTDFHEWLHQT